MKVCVFGVGAVGGQVAARLASSQLAEVSVVARGAQLGAIRKRGIILRSDGKDIVGKPAMATDNPAELPPQDLVAVTLKATALPAAAESIARLLAPNGCAVFLNNGIPWWWPHGLNGASGPPPLIDPEGKLWTHVRPERALGCVVYSPNDLIAPGVTLHVGGNRWVMGEPDGFSMLQDVLQGRPIEVEVQLGQTQAFAREKGIAVPTIDTLLPLLRGLDRALRQARAKRILSERGPTESLCRPN